MYVKTPGGDSYDLYYEGSDGELHKVGWVDGDSIKAENLIDTGLVKDSYEFKATVEVNPDWVKQLKEETKKDAQKNIELLNKVVAGLCCCIFGEERNCGECPFREDHYSCRLHLFETARSAIFQYRKVYEQMIPKDE